MQGMISQVITQRKVIPANSDKAINVDVRILSATDEHLTHPRQFSGTLYRQLSKTHINTIPLRNLVHADNFLLELVSHLVYKITPFNRITCITRKSLEFLSKLEFKDNVRELEEILNRAVAENRQSSIISIKETKETQHEQQLLDASAPVLSTNKTGFSREIPYSQSVENNTKILYLSADLDGLSERNFVEEIREIELIVHMSKFRDHFVIKPQMDIRASDLQEILLRFQPHIVHFSGYGNLTSEIIMKNKAGKRQPVPCEALSRTFASLKDNIRCVILNACYSEKQAKAIAGHIDCVVGMRKNIGNQTAISFAVAFYRALAFGRSIKKAFDLGCAQIHLDNLDEADVPQLLPGVQVDPDSIIFVQ